MDHCACPSPIFHFIFGLGCFFLPKCHYTREAIQDCAQSLCSELSTVSLANPLKLDTLLPTLLLCNLGTRNSQTSNNTSVPFVSYSECLCGHHHIVAMIKLIYSTSKILSKLS